MNYISHRPTQTYTDKFFSLDDIVQGKTVCPVGKQFFYSLSYLETRVYAMPIGLLKIGSIVNREAIGSISPARVPRGNVSVSLCGSVAN
jgi:hypothetical protein